MLFFPSCLPTLYCLSLIHVFVDHFRLVGVVYCFLWSSRNFYIFPVINKHVPNTLGLQLNSAYIVVVITTSNNLRTNSPTSYIVYTLIGDLGLTDLTLWMRRWLIAFEPVQWIEETRSKKSNLFTFVIVIVNQVSQRHS